jgi:polysaccharide pyruvyl transferase WcaK-like protein
MTASGSGGGAGLRILIENSEYWLRNNGDLAMFEVTIRRLRERWPNARIGVLTDSPSLVRAYYPEAEAMTVWDTDPWDEPTRLERFAAKVGPTITGPVAISWLQTRGWVPDRARRVRRKLLRFAGAHTSDDGARPPRPHTGSARAAREASLVLALGGGYLTDSDKGQANRVMNLFEHAFSRDVPVAMVGQGLGPMEDPILLERLANVLPKVEVISLREKRRGPGLLEKIGFPSDRVLVTGDDAIELSYEVRTDVVGTDLGICLRVAEYSPVSKGAQETVGKVVRTLAAEFDAGLVPLIIAEYRRQDRRSTLPLVSGAPKVTRPLGKFVAPQDIAKRVSQCRVLVTGAYHLAVFALSQGIPVIALTSSQYYDEKFLGLGEMFGLGLQVVRLDEEGLSDRLTDAIRNAWASATEVREPLRARALEQIEASKAGFARIFELVERTAAEKN